MFRSERVAIVLFDNHCNYVPVESRATRLCAYQGNRSPPIRVTSFLLDLDPDFHSDPDYDPGCNPDHDHDPYAMTRESACVCTV